MSHLNLNCIIFRMLAKQAQMPAFCYAVPKNFPVFDDLENSKQRSQQGRMGSIWEISHYMDHRRMKYMHIYYVSIIYIHFMLCMGIAYPICGISFGELVPF